MNAAEIDAVIQRLAGAQHGIVTRAQLVQAGVGDDAIAVRTARGWLRRVHRGVFQAGPVGGRFAPETAAALACGPDAVVSHRSAAALWQMLPPDRSAPVDVLVAASRRSPPGLRLRRYRRLDDDEVTAIEGVRVTTPARTILDLAAGDGVRHVERAVQEAFARRLVTLEELTTLVARHPRRPGTAGLRALVREGRPARVRSKGERLLFTILERADAGTFRRNDTVCGHEVDVVFPRERVVVEFDGYATHSSSPAFEEDRRRDADLHAAGYRVLRVTWRRLTKEREKFLVQVGRLLGQGSPAAEEDRAK